MIRPSVLLVSCVVAAGCTTTSLKVSKVDSSKPETHIGAPYSLMLTRYRIDVARQVTGCGSKMKTLVKAEIKSVESAADPKQQFVLDPNSLANGFKTSEVKLTYYPSGAVASLNASSEDRTTQVVSNVAATVVKSVTIMAASGAAPGPAGIPEVCNQQVLDALADIKKYNPQVDAATKAVDTLTADIKNLLAKVAAASGNPDEATKKLLSKRYDSLALANENLKEKTAALNKALKLVTYTETIIWPPDGNTWTKTLPLSESIFNRWGNVDTDEKARAQFSVTLALGLLGQNGREVPPTRSDVKPELGIPYRLPLTGRLDVCAGDTCATTDVPLASNDGGVLQLGEVYYLPCISRPFANMNCSFEMTDAGQIKSIGTTQKAAAAEGATSALKDVVTQAASLQDTLSTLDTKKLQAKTAALKAETDYAAAAAALPDAAQTAALKAHTDLLNAQRAQIEADAALTAAMSKAGKL